MATNGRQARRIECRQGGQVSFWLFALLFAADMAIPVVLGPYYPNYSHIHDTLSTLGHQESPVAGSIKLWLLFFGVALCIPTILNWRQIGRNGQLAIFSSGLLAFAIGAGIIAGLFPEDLPGEAETLNGKFHGIGAGLGSLGLLVGLVAGARLVQGRERQLVIGLVLIAWFGFILFLGSKAPEMFAGLWQKVYLGAAYLAVLKIVRPCRSMDWNAGP